MVSNFALPSVFGSTYENWELTIIDDSCAQDAEQVVDEFTEKYKHDKSKIKILPTKDSMQEKEKRGGSTFGAFANEALETLSKADICLMLCDDDAIHEKYLQHLNEYYCKNPEVIYSYCKVSIYDPLCHKDFFEIQKIPSLKEPSQHPLNHSGVLKTVSCQVDASQVSWRRSKFLEDEVRFASPLTLNVDAALYGQMADKWGGCEGNEILGQYKAVFSYQLGALEKIYNTLETEND